jgi:hypothetical protein
MANVATPIVGLIALTNSLLVSNYLYIRGQRKLTDARTQDRLDHDGEPFRERTELGVRNSFDWVGKCIKRTCAMAMAFFCGYIGKETNSTMKFPRWDPIRYGVGKISTITLLVIIAGLFQKRSLYYWFGVKPSGVNIQQVLCTSKDSESKVANFTDILKTETKMDLARAQHDHTSAFFDALQKDTALYGTEGYECGLKPQTKEAFLATDGYGKESGVNYFPGYCEAAQGSALSHARNTTCTKQMCGGGEAITGANVEFTENRWETAGAIFAGEAPDAELEYTYGYKEFCEEVRVPCPDFSVADELDDVLQDYKLEQYKKAENATNGAEAITQSAIPAAVQQAGQEIAQKLLTQIDVASTAYVIYSCLSLLFPSPMFIFRPQYTVAVKRLLFGARKHVFIMVVLVMWWGATYVRSFKFDIYYKVYVQKLLQKSPCLGDPGFVMKVGRTFLELCDDLVNMESEWTIKSTAINQTLNLVDMFRDCQCEFPFVHLEELMPTNRTGAEHLETVLFGRNHGDLCGSTCECRHRSCRTSC